MAEYNGPTLPKAKAIAEWLQHIPFIAQVSCSIVTDRPPGPPDTWLFKSRFAIRWVRDGAVYQLLIVTPKNRSQLAGLKDYLDSTPVLGRPGNISFPKVIPIETLRGGRMDANPRAVATPKIMAVYEQLVTLVPLNGKPRVLLTHPSRVLKTQCRVSNVDYYLKQLTKAGLIVKEDDHYYLIATGLKGVSRPNGHGSPPPPSAPPLKPVGPTIDVTSPIDILFFFTANYDLLKPLGLLQRTERVGEKVSTAEKMLTELRAKDLDLIEIERGLAIVIRSDEEPAGAKD